MDEGRLLMVLVGDDICAPQIRIASQEHSVSHRSLLEQLQKRINLPAY